MTTSTNFRSILEVTPDEWLDATGLTEAEIPDCVIIEGSWWRAQRQAWRLGYLTDVRELTVPDIFWGRWRDKKIAFCMAYGAPRAGEIIHLFGVLGCRLAIQIGTCGGLQSHLRPGDIVLPEHVTGQDGVAHLYTEGATVSSSAKWLATARGLLEYPGRQVHIGPHVTFSSLFAETVEMYEAWHAAGLLSVDMETATTLSVARSFRMEAVSLLVVWDELTRGRRFLDPIEATDLAALDRSNKDVFETALALAAQL